MYEHREELAALITRDHGKTFPDALAEVLRGIETHRLRVRPAGPPRRHDDPQRVEQGRRVHAARAAGRRGGDHAVQLPGDGPDLDLPDRADVRQHGRSSSRRRHTPGATQLQAELWTQAGGPDGTFNIVYGGKRGREGDRRAPRTSGRSSSSELHSRRPLRLRGGDEARQARRVLHLGQERDARPARRGHGPGRRRGGRGGLRLGRRAVHGPDADGRGRRHGRAPQAQDPGPDREAQGRRRHAAGHRHGSDLLRASTARRSSSGSTSARPRAPSSSSTAASSRARRTPTASSSASRCSTTSRPR